MAIGLFSFFVLGAVIGVAMAISGFRGKRVGDHPFCRNCGFDLFGQPSPLRRCSECGTSISRSSDTVMIGQRVRNQRRFWFGASVAVASFISFVCIGSSTFPIQVFTFHKPLWWVKLDAKSSDPQIAQIAIAELFRRTKVDPSVSGEVASFILDMVPIQITARPVIRKGDAWSFWYQGPAQWHARASLGSPAVRVTLESIDIEGVRAYTSANSTVDSRQVAPYEGCPHICQSLGGDWAKLTTGSHRANYKFSLSVVGIVSQPQAVQIESKLKIVEPPEDSVVLVHDAALATKMREAICLVPFAMEPSHAPLRIVPGGATLDRIRVVSLPANLCCRVVARDKNGFDRLLGFVQFDKSDGVASSQLNPFCPIPATERWSGFDSDVVDIILQPDIENARSNAKFTEIYGDEIVLKNVAVSWEGTQRPFP